MRKITDEIFYSRTAKRGDCLEWTGATNHNGYGAVCGGLAHRRAWQMANGPIPAGLCVLHRCDNRLCVAVEHLFLGTQAENVADMDAKRRRVPPAGERNARSKLSPYLVREMLLLGGVGAPVPWLAREYGISDAATRAIMCGKNWRHLGLFAEAA